jgi:hypothetical protein
VPLSGTGLANIALGDANDFEPVRADVAPQRSIVGPNTFFGAPSGVLVF